MDNDKLRTIMVQVSENDYQWAAEHLARADKSGKPLVAVHRIQPCEICNEEPAVTAFRYKDHGGPGIVETREVLACRRCLVNYETETGILSVCPICEDRPATKQGKFHNKICENFHSLVSGFLVD